MFEMLAPATRSSGVSAVIVNVVLAPDARVPIAQLTVIAPTAPVQGMLDEA